MAFKTYIKQFVHSGAETNTNAWSGLPNERVGASGIVEVAIFSTKAENTFTIKVLETGTEVVPEGSIANLKGSADAAIFDRNSFIYRAENLMPGGTLAVTVVAAAASEDEIAIRTQ